MATVGEFKKKFEELPDSAQLEFWVVLNGKLVELTVNPDKEYVRSPAADIAEVLLTLPKFR